MTPDEIQTLYNQELPVLNAWGLEIASKINENFSAIIKIKSSHRVKELQSLTAKALYRNKAYDNPYIDITDRVGVRAVVLLEKDVTAITEWIKAIPIWTFSLDRHFETERLRDPTVFNYQSNHLVLRSIGCQTFQGIEIAPDTPCEVQVRTLLQHAYSELSHDLIYKSKLLVNPEVKRLAARSMALIETADRVFLDVHHSIAGQDAALREAEEITAQMLIEHGITGWNEKVNQIVLDSFRDLIAEIKIVDLKAFFTERNFIFDRIKEWDDEHQPLKVPAILIAFFLAISRPTSLISAWPYTRNEIDKVYTILGQRPPD